MREVWSVSWSHETRNVVIRENGILICLSDRETCNHTSPVQDYEDLMSLALHYKRYRLDLESPPNQEPSASKEVASLELNDVDILDNGPQNSSNLEPEVVIDARFYDYGQVIGTDGDPELPAYLREPIDGMDYAETIRKATYRSLENKFRLESPVSDFDEVPEVPGRKSSTEAVNSTEPFCDHLVQEGEECVMQTCFPFWLRRHLELHQEVKACNSCNAHFKKGSQSNVKIFGELGPTTSNISVVFCEQCRYGVNEDGSVWLFEGKFGFESTLFWGFLENILHNAATITGYCESITKAIQRRTQSFVEFAPIRVFTAGLSIFLKAHPFPETFACGTCSSRPKVVIADGKQIGFQKSRLLNPTSDDMPPWEYYGTNHTDHSEARPLTLWKIIRSKGPDATTGPCRKDFRPKKRLTGGIMALWCPHGTCVGFHIIGRAEGLRDVYAAIRSHWENAPDVIVYDLSCALEGYCRSRDQQWFRNTKFIVDDFH